MKENEFTIEELRQIGEITVDLPYQGFHLEEFDVKLLTPEQRIWLTVGRLSDDIDPGFWLEVWDFLSEEEG